MVIASCVLVLIQKRFLLLLTFDIDLSIAEYHFVQLSVSGSTVTFAIWRLTIERIRKFKGILMTCKALMFMEVVVVAGRLII